MSVDGRHFFLSQHVTDDRDYYLVTVVDKNFVRTRVVVTLVFRSSDFKVAPGTKNLPTESQLARLLSLTFWLESARTNSMQR